MHREGQVDVQYRGKPRRFTVFALRHLTTPPCGNPATLASIPTGSAGFP